MLPQNRRLRHLQGIYLRNLSFFVNHGRAVDDLDADLRISADYNSKLEDDAPPQQQLHQSLSSDSLLQRPDGRRRRSTTLANVSPVTRQKQLEYAVESRAADVFFSLHCCEGIEGEEDDTAPAVYVSEVGERAMNFNFRFFDLGELGPFVTRSSIFTVKIWARRWHNRWALLLEQHVDLRSLNYLGTTLRNRQFPPNCLVFQLADGGVYALEKLDNKQPEPKQSPALPTSSYNALMKLSNLDNSIQDALATREALTAQINEILARSANRIDNDVPRAQESALLASRYLASQNRSLKAAQTRRAELRASIDARRRAIAEGRAAQARAEAEVRQKQTTLPALRSQVAATREAIRGQRRRICEDLSKIFPITPVPPDPVSGAPPPPLSFRICGFALPNTEYDPASLSAEEDALSAGLGYVAQLVHLLQFYLGVPLPYPVSPFGSRSSVRDDISLLPETSTSSMSPASSTSRLPSSTSYNINTTTARQRQHMQLQRDFPLFLRGGATAQYRFDYAWFLLNKDIEALCSRAPGVGLRVVDIRHTLPNLKYLIYVGSAGTDEVPERKRGGVRGLWAGRMRSRIGLSGGAGGGGSLDDGASSAGGSSRRGSTDSEVLGASGGRLQDQLKQAMASAAAAAASSSGNGHAHAHHIHADSGVSGLVVVSGAEEDITTTKTNAGLEKTQTQTQPSSASHSHSSISIGGVGVGVGGLPFDEGGTKLTLRTKGLRENVGAHA